MRRLLLGCALPALLLWMPVAGAVDGKLGMRANAGYGSFEGEIPGGTDTANTWTAGLGANFIFLPKRQIGFFVDVGLDYYDVKDGLDLYADFVRTDLTVTAGARVIQILSPFIGLRSAWQDSEDVFGDDTWTETGSYVGIGVGPVPIGGPLRLSGSVAYNFNDIELPGGGEFDYDGASAKARVSVGNHGLELRYQRFEADPPISLEETYIYGVYVFNFNLFDF